MSGLSGHLHSSQNRAPVCCGEAQAKEKDCVVSTGGVEGPQLWTRELSLQAGFQDPSRDGLALVTPEHIPPSSPSVLANGVHLQRRLKHNTFRRRPTETQTTIETETFAETLRNMQTHIDPDVHAQAFSFMDNGGHKEINAYMSPVGPELSKTLTSEAICTTSPKPLSLALGNHPASINQVAAPVQTSEADPPSTLCLVPPVPNPSTGSSPLPAETEKKYALRSSGRPSLRCHLRKSSRLRRTIEDDEKRPEGEMEGEKEEMLEEKIWRVKEDEVAADNKEELSSVEAILPTPTSQTDLALALTVPKPAPKVLPKPGPRLGHKPGPKSRCRPAPKSVHKAGPKSVMKQRQAAQAIYHCATPLPPFASSVPAPVLTMKEEPITDLGACPPSNSRRGRFVGVS